MENIKQKNIDDKDKTDLTSVVLSTEDPEMTEEDLIFADALGKSLKEDKDISSIISDLPVKDFNMDEFLAKKAENDKKRAAGILEPIEIINDIDEEIEKFMNEDNQKTTPEEERKTIFPFKFTKRKKKVLQAVCILAVFFVSSSAMALWMNDQSAEAGRMPFVDQLKNMLFASTDENESLQEYSEVVAILDEDRIAEGKEFLSELYVPTYIPEGYVFEKLNIEKRQSGNYNVKYTYCDKNNRAEFVIQQSKIANALTFEGATETITTSKGDVFIQYKDIDGIIDGNLITNEVDYFHFFGSISKKELKKVVEGLNQD